MAKRFTIGLNYFYNNETNSGVVNYIFNIISALKTLDNKDKPQIVIFHNDDSPIAYLKKIDYPYIRFSCSKNRPTSYLIRKANSFTRRFLDFNVFQYFQDIKGFQYRKIDCIYPWPNGSTDNMWSRIKNKVHWLVDFNNLRFPDHYLDKGYDVIKSQEKITASQDRVVLSSFALLDELKEFYPNYKCDVRILRFASSLNQKSAMSRIELLNKYSISTQYFISPNQFWEHKNQIVVLKAIHLIKSQKPEINFKVVFTGSLEVNRGKGKFSDVLKNAIADMSLENYIVFLGVVERQEQIDLMRNASAILQPSLYEGWSTLVEEAKALNKFIVLSNLKVHHEQIKKNAEFFNPFDAAELAEKMIKILLYPPVVEPLDYQENIRTFAKDIMTAFR